MDKPKETARSCQPSVPITQRLHRETAGMGVVVRRTVHMEVGWKMCVRQEEVHHFGGEIKTCEKSATPCNLST